MIRMLPVVALLVACNPPLTDDNADTSDTNTAPAEFAFSTSAWTDGATIPAEYTCAGTGGWNAQDNPELTWANAPEGTAAFAMLYVDTDLGDWRHWAFYTSDASVNSIPRGTSNTVSLPAGVTELTSGDGRVGYVPNCPSGSMHTYEFTLWAVSDASALTGMTTFADLKAAAEANSLGSLSFTGLSDASQ
ncbi:MAG: YbhB/YbcL family Raf kinase inhibitor-like protein [Proteobacteria bacterium]|nr:YbhB/YbcL family Raf kinase inhibitor-like protein [Pseudomonadota bacterium]